MKSETGVTDEGGLRGTTGETENDADDAATPPTICFVCQRPISEDAHQLPRGEPAHPDCAAERRAALSRRTPRGE